MIERLVDDSEPVKQYIEASRTKTDRFHERYEGYKPDPTAITELKKHRDTVIILAFSAEWCPDCYRNVPVLAHIAEQTGIQARVFGHLMRDAKNDKRRWAVPPSPAEVDEFNVEKIPTFIAMTVTGEELGRVVENPPEGVSLEQALLDLLQASHLYQG